MNNPDTPPKPADTEQPSGKGLDKTACSRSSDTPESDNAIIPFPQEPAFKGAMVPHKAAQKLERERDKLHMAGVDLIRERDEWHSVAVAGFRKINDLRELLVTCHDLMLGRVDGKHPIWRKMRELQSPENSKHSNGESNNNES